MAVRRESSVPTPKKKKKPPISPVVGPTTEERAEASRTAPTRKEIGKEGRQKLAAPAFDTATVTPEEVVSTKERKAASRSTRKRATDKQRRALHIAEAYAGTREPKTKAERRAAAKGEAIERILTGKETDKPKHDYMAYRDADTDLLRITTLRDLQRSKRNLEEKIDVEERKKKVKGFKGAEPSIQRALVKKHTAQLDQTNLHIARLRRDTVQDEIETRQKIINKLKDAKGDDKYSNQKIDKAVTKQRNAIEQARIKKSELKLTLDSRKEQARKTKRQQAHRLVGAQEVLEEAASDPMTEQLALEGIRTRGQYEDTKVKFVGVPGWTDVELAKPASALETAAEFGLTLAPVPGVGLLAKGGMLGTKALKASGLPGTLLKGAVAGARRGVTVPGAKLGGAALSVLGKTPLRGVAAKAAVSGTIRSGSIKRGITTRIRPGQATRTADGGVIVRSGKVKGAAAQSQADDIARSVDDVILGIPNRLKAGIPVSADARTMLGYRLAGLLGKTAAAGGLAVGVPSLADTDNEAAQNIYRDTRDLIVGFVPSTYEALDAGVSAAFGESEKLDAMWDMMKEHDPIVLSAQGRWEEALTAWEERPVSTLLELGGVEYALGRTLGTAMRYSPRKMVHSLQGKKLTGVGSGWADRARIMQLGDAETRAMLADTYSADIFRKGVQKGLEKLDAYAAKKGGFRSNLEITRDRERIKRVDEDNGANLNAATRDHLDVVKEMSGLMRRAEKVNAQAPNALHFIASNVIRTRKTAVTDTRNYLEDLIRQQKSRNPVIRGSVMTQAFRAETIGVLQRLLHPKNRKALQDQRVWNLVDDYVKSELDNQDALIEISGLTHKTAEWAKWVPYMTRHLDGEFIERNGKTVFALGEQLKIDNKFGPKYLDPDNPKHLDAVKAHARQGDDPVPDPGFFSMRSLSDDVLAGGKNVSGRAPQFYRRSGDAVRTGTLDPTFNALFAHRMALKQSVRDATYVTEGVRSWNPFRGKKGDTIVFENAVGQRIEAFGPLTKAESERRAGEEEFYQDTYEAVNRRLEEAHEAGELNRNNYQLFNLEVYNTRMAQARNLGDTLQTANRYGDGSSDVYVEALRAAKEGDKNNGTWVAMPKDVIKRWQDHGNVMTSMMESTATRYAAMFTREFKGGVLPFNPRWQFGNIFDMTTRALMDQTGPLSYARGQAILFKLKRMDRAAYDDLLDRIGSGMMSETFGRTFEDITLQPKAGRRSKDKYGTARTGHELRINTLRSMLRQPAEATEMVNRASLIVRGFLPWMVRKFGGGYRMAQRGAFAVGKGAEKQYRIAQLGKAEMRIMRNIENEWQKSLLVTPKAIEDTVLRLKDSNARAAAGRAVNNVMGDYTRLSPEMRRATMTYAPFALWMRASLTWVFTLPAKSPIKTGVIASINRLTEEDRARIGLSRYNVLERNLETGQMLGEGEVTERMFTKPDYLLGAIPVGDQLLPTKTLSSFGTLYAGPQEIGEFLLPQITAPILNLAGVSWTGEKLVNPNGKEISGVQAAGIALSGFAETMFPLAKWYKYAKADGAPDETATIFHPTYHDEVLNRDLRDTFVSHFPGAARYEQPAEDVLRGLFSPIRTEPMDFEESDEELPPATEGPAAFSAGKLEAEQQETSSASGQGWMQGERALEQREAREDTEPRKKVRKNWLQGER